MHVLFRARDAQRAPKTSWKNTCFMRPLWDFLVFVPAENAGARGSAELDTGDSQTRAVSFLGNVWALIVTIRLWAPCSQNLNPKPSTVYGKNQ